jgi:hypothetical protein
LFSSNNALTILVNNKKRRISADVLPPKGKKNDKRYIANV